ncbi:hypothetical protein K456DRAFT_1753276 [Colletotrichum gloeosporioides 23]|nr:hypothetical protein K456DRAFT_1753276 [Colletotrichum gloeosporioides 23]
MLVPDNPGDPALLVNGSIWSMAAVSTTFLALRIYCKAFRVRWMVWLDDWLLIAGWVFLIASQSFLSELMRLGFARTYNVTSAMKTLIYVYDNCHKVSLGLTKTSFAVTLPRISSTRQKYFIGFLVITMNIQFIIHVILTWRPICPIVPGDPTPHLPVSCWESPNATALGVVGGFYSAAADVLLALLPWKIVMGLQMKKHEKIGVAIAMSMGVLAEPNVTNIAASIPVLRVLFRNIRSQRETEYRSSGAYIRSDNLSKFQNQGMSAGRSTTVEDHDKRGDGDSDRSILPQCIVRTTEVTIDYDKRSGISDNGVSGEDGIELRSYHTTPM